MADTYDLDPAVRIEEILNGDDIEPANRLEYFLKKAATEVPKPTAADAGKVLKVNNTGDGYELGEGGGGADIYVGNILTKADVPPLPEGYTMADEYNALSLSDPVNIYLTDSSATDPYQAVYPSMGEIKPAILVRNESASVHSVRVANVIVYDPTITFYPVAEDLSKNYAYLTVKTACPMFLLDIGLDARILAIEKNNLKWVLYDPKHTD